MAETKKSTHTRKPARTIEQQIADLQAKAEAKQQKRRDVAWKKHESAVESAKKAKARYINAMHAVDEQRQVLEDLGVQVEDEADPAYNHAQADVES